MPFDNLPESNPGLSVPWRKALWDAAQIVERGGHCKRMLVAGSNHCAVGAILDALELGAASVRHVSLPLVPTFRQAVTALERQLGVEPEKTTEWEYGQRAATYCQHTMWANAVPSWNNRPACTPEEVIETLRLAALGPEPEGATHELESVVG